MKSTQAHWICSNVGIAIVLAIACLCVAEPPSLPLVTTVPTTSPSRASIQNRKIWNRTWEDIDLRAGVSLIVPLRFSFVPTRATWKRPGGSVEPATGTERDITAAGYEIVIQLDAGTAQRLEVDVDGRSRSWNRVTQVFDGGTVTPGPDGMITLCLVVGSSSKKSPTLLLRSEGGGARVKQLDVFGLRAADLTAEESRIAAAAFTDHRVFYQSHCYTVFGNRVEDDVYGPPAAFVPNRNTIVSPTRVIEGFELKLDRWQSHPQSRVVDHQTVWHPHPEVSRLPMLETKWPTVDAAYRVALDVLHRCSTEEFIDDDADRGKWQAGFFMGPRFGFGIWMRDSTHIALRGGNVLDPKVARATLVHTTKSGIDNGCDGVLMPIVGLWDYYLVTGDRSAIDESWANLKNRIASIDAQFDENKGLVRAAHSTSNDAFAEPESGGFALGTEAYFMLAYRAMAELGQIVGEDATLINMWGARAKLLRDNIRLAYWNGDAGYFTTGPSGSDGFRDGNWETAGQELAIWPRFDIATAEQRRRVLDRLPLVAMNEFGVDVFPYRPETDHFRGAGWVVWTAGISAAANQEGRLDVLHHLIGQQVRNAVMNKTFYEVVDCESGRAWRWPGQVWQAAGFLSYIYCGLLGMEFDQRGLSLNAAVPESLADFRVTGFAYRNAILDIQVNGWGMDCQVYLDGTLDERIPASLTGRHEVDLRVVPTPSDKALRLVPLQHGRLPTTAPQ